MIRTRAVARSTGWIVLDRATAAGCGLVSLMIAGRVLGAGGFGHLAVAQTFVPLFLFLADWGIGTAVTAELSRGSASPRRVLGTASLLRVPLCAAAWLACLGSAWILGYRADRFGDILLFSLILWLPITDTFSTVFPVALRMRAPSIISMTCSVLQLAMVALCGALRLGPRSFLLAIALAFCARSLVTAIFGLRRESPPLGFDRDLARRLLRSGTLLSAAAVFTLLINGMPTLLLDRMHGAPAAGLYSVGARVLLLVYALPIALMTTMLPLMARVHGEDPEAFRALYRRTRDLLFCVGLLVGAGATLLARPAIHLIFGESFAGAVGPFSILLWQPVLVCPWIVTSNALIAQRRERANLLLVIMTCGAVALLSAAFIPVWGVAGAAAASLLGFVPVALLSTFLALRGAVRGSILVETREAEMAP